MISQRVVGIYVSLAIGLVVSVGLCRAKAEKEYCAIVGIELTVKQVFWSQYTCREPQVLLHEMFPRQVPPMQ